MRTRIRMFVVLSMLVVSILDRSPQVGIAQESRIRYGDTVSGSISTRSVSQTWIFEGEAGDMVEVIMERDDGDLDTYLILLDPNDNVLAENDDDTGTERSRIVFRLQATGEHAILATRYNMQSGSSTGTYRLALSKVDIRPVAPADLIPYASSEMRGGTFGFGYPSNWVVTEYDGEDFTSSVAITNAVGTEPADLDLELGMVNIFIFPPSVVKSLVSAESTAYGALETLKAENEGDDDTDIGEIVHVSVGDYPAFGASITQPYDNREGMWIAIDYGSGNVVLVAGLASIGEFALFEDTLFDILDTLTFTPHIITGIPLNVGDTMVGELTPDHLYEYYTFYGEAGSRIQITLKDNDSDVSLDTYLRFMDSNQVVLEENDDSMSSSDSLIDTTLPASGNYLIEVSSYGGDTGRYVLTLSPSIGGAYSDGWNVYIANIQTYPSTNRGWKTVTLDVVFESTTYRPFPLYYERRVAILDSTGNWRSVDLSSDSTDDVLRVPEGIRFVRSSNEIQVPENATLEQFEVTICGSSDCDPNYAVFSVIIDEASSDSSFVYPYETLPHSVPLLADSPIIVQIPDLTGANIAFLPDITVSVEDWISLDFYITVENLTGNNLTPQTLDLDWLTTSVLNNGSVFVYEASCSQLDGRSWSVPPGYIDTLHCRSVVSFRFDTVVDLHRLWIGFSTADGTPFLQTVIDQ